MYKNKLIVSIILLLVLLLLLNGCNKGDEQLLDWAQKHGYNPDEVYHIIIGDYGFPYIEGYINDNSILFAIDTGNLVGTMISQVKAKDLNLKQIDKWRLIDSAGSIVGEYDIYKVDSLKLFDTTFNNKKVYMMKDNTLEGSIGVDSLLDKSKITFDYRNGFLGISKSSQGLSLESDLELPLVWNDRYKGLLVVEGHVNGVKTLIQIDTGKSRTCVDERLVKKLNLPSNRGGYEINEIKLGPYIFSIKNAKKTSFSGISKGYPEPIMLGIGSDIISQIILTIDYLNKRIIIEK